MHELTLRGTPAQMGMQHGAMLAQTEGGLILPPLNPALLPLAADCEKVAQQHTPRFVEEMGAFAEAANIPYDALMAVTLTIPLAQTMPSCSVVAVLPERSATGQMMVGRNYDFSYDLEEGSALYHTFPDAGYKHTGACDIWIGREDGLNEHGLFVAMSATFLPGIQAGLPFWFIIRHMLEHCATVDEAAAWIQSVPHSQSRNYMLADRNKALVAEASINGVCFREAQDGVLVMTNHPATPELRPQASFEPPDSQVRFDRLQSLHRLPDGHVTSDDLEAAMNDRENHVCAHHSFDGQMFGTLWSMIAYPSEQRLAIARGTGDNQGTMKYQDYRV